MKMVLMIVCLLVCVSQVTVADMSKASTNQDSGTSDKPVASRNRDSEPDLSLSTAVMINSGELVGMCNLPFGGGTPLSDCYTYGGDPYDATIEVTLLNSMGAPVVGYPADAINVISTRGGLVPCGSGVTADIDTDINGKTTISLSIMGGGHTFSGYHEETLVTVADQPITGSTSLWIFHNSPDINGDLIVDLVDVPLLAYYYYAGYYHEAIDFNWTLNIEIADVAYFANNLCDGCLAPKIPEVDDYTALCLGIGPPYEFVGFVNWLTPVFEAHLYVDMLFPPHVDVNGLALSIHASNPASVIYTLTEINGGATDWLDLGNETHNPRDFILGIREPFAGFPTPVIDQTFLWLPTVGGLSFTFGPTTSHTTTCMNYTDPVYVSEGELYYVEGYAKNGQVEHQTVWINPEQSVVETIDDVADDEGLSMQIGCYRSGYDAPDGPYLVTYYEVYREIDEKIKNPVTKAGKLDGWDLVLSTPADGADLKTFVVPTVQDSTITDGLYLSTFLVRACTADPGIYFDSNPVSGYSLDNLDPGSPEPLTIAYGLDGNIMTWDESTSTDVIHYNIYRGLDPADPPQEEDTPLAEVTGCGWTDDLVGAEHPAWAYFYWILAVDDAGNRSDLEDWDTATITATNEQDLPIRNVLHQNMPNPFNPQTTITYELAQTSTVRLAIYDISGRLVRVLKSGETEAAGMHRVVWCGEDSRGGRVAAGVFFYRLEAGDYICTLRMMLVK